MAKNYVAPPKNQPKVLIFDIETSPHEARVFDLFNQNVSLNQVTKYRSVLSWAAKWLGSDKMMYDSTAGQRNVRDDKRIMKSLHKLLDEADIIITQNGKRFDVPIVRGRMTEHGMKPFSPFSHIDTCQLATKMGFPSKKLAYLTKALCPELEKSKHNSFPGMDLWNACLGDFGSATQKKAWREMEAYNKQDVLGTEGVYKRLAPWGVGINLNVYHDKMETVCTCGSTNFTRKGYAYTPIGKYQIYRCKQCGSWIRGKTNLLDKDKRKTLKKAV